MASYGAVIEVSVKGQQALDQLEGSARKIQNLIQGIKQQRSVFDQAVGSDKTRELKRNLENLVATFAGAKEGARQFKVTVGGTEQTVNMYSKTLAGLNSQLSTFRSIANNATVGTDQYRNAVVAANKVSNEFARTQAKAFNVNTSVSGMNVKDVIALGKSIPDTIEGLDFYQSALEDVLRTVRLGSNDFRALEEAIASTGARRNAARLTGQTSAINAASGPFSRIDTVAAKEKSVAYAKQIADLEYKQLLTGQQLVKAKLSQSQQDELQNRLAQASDALANGELDVAKRLTVELRNQRIAYERLNRAQESLMRPTSMTAGAAESVTGRRPGGLPPVFDSPAYKAAAAKAAAATPSASKAATTTVNNQVAAQKRLNNLLASAQILEQKGLEYKAKGLQVDQQIVNAQKIIQSIQQNSNNVTKQYLDALDSVVNTLRNELLLRKAISVTQKAQATQATQANKAAAGGAAKPTQKDGDGGGAGLQNALIGGAFPLLFGGGPGAVVGGFAGGFTFDNPMMSIVTSAIGTIIDRIVAGARVAGEAVRTLDTAIQHMSDNALFSSKQTEFLAKTYEEYGRSSLALQVVQEELNRKIGYEGVASLQRLGDASSALNRAWADVNLQIQTALAGPLAGLLKWIADVLAMANQGGEESKKSSNLADRLTPAQRKQLEKDLIPTYGPMGRLGPAAKSEEQTRILAQYEKLATKQVQTNIRLSDEQLLTQLQNGEKLYTQLADLERELNDKKRQYAEQYFDMSLALTRQQYDLTEQLQRKATDTQIQSLQKELEILKSQGDIQIQIARNVVEARRLNAAPGTDLETQLLTAIGEYGIRRQEIDNEAADRERQVKLEMLRFDIENERYKLDNAKTIARLNFDNQTKIARINEEINRQNAAVARENYRRQIAIAAVELARVTAQLEADNVQLQTQKDIAKAQGRLNTDAELYYNSLMGANTTALEKYQPLQAELKTARNIFTAPSSVPQMGALPQLSMDTRAVDSANKSLELRVEAYKELLNTQGKLTQEEAARLQLLSQIDQAYVRPLNDIVKAQKDQLQYQQYYTDEINKGSITALAQEKGRIDALFEPSLLILNTQIARLEAQKAITGLTQVELDVLNGLVATRERLSQAAGVATFNAQIKQDPSTRLQDAITGLRGELNDLTDPVNQVIAGAEAIGGAFSESFKGIMSGAMSAQEALASFFQSVADHFLDMAAQMIAKWIQLTILNSVLRLFPGGSGVGASSNGMFGTGAPTEAFAGGGIFSGAGPYQFRANGGPVTSGSPYIVGERGPELFVPGRSGTIVPNDKMGGGSSTNVVVNVDASGSKVEGNDQQGNQLGRVIAAAVQQELIKQKRPGGLLV